MFQGKGFKPIDVDADRQRMYADLMEMARNDHNATLLLEAKKMRELLHAMNEATGPGASLSQLTDALKAVSDYLSPLNEVGK